MGEMNVGSRGDVAVVIGEVDTATAPTLEKDLSGRLAAGAKSLVVDMAGVKYISSAGVGVFLSLIGKVKKGGGKIVLVAVPPNIKRVFDTLGFSRAFAFAATEEEARAALG